MYVQNTLHRAHQSGALEIATMLRLRGATRPKIVSNTTITNNQRPVKQFAIAPTV